MNIKIETGRNRIAGQRFSVAAASAAIAIALMAVPQLGFAQNLGNVATNVNTNIAAWLAVIFTVARLAGFGLGVYGLYKLYKNNQEGARDGTKGAWWAIVIGALMIFMPFIVTQLLPNTFFGSTTGGTVLP